MKKIALILSVAFLCSAAEAKDPVLLSNDSWPPFILEGDDQGTSERLVCEALERSGRPCRVDVKEWSLVLEEARIGAIDGIAAAWRTPEREEYLLFSEPYLSNQIVPVASNTGNTTIKSAADLAGKRVALVTDYAYGDKITALSGTFTIVNAQSSLDALKLVTSGKAEVALVDDLVSRDAIAADLMEDLIAFDVVLAFRDLHFAVSLQNPMAEAIIDDFQRAYKLMLTDGTVNEILNVDWLATDFGQKGSLNVVMRSGVSLDDLASPANDGEVFALEASEYDIMQKKSIDPSRVKYQVDGNSYSTLQAAMDDAFGKDTPCKHKNYTSQFDCTDLFKSNRR